jgi:hypothetical protein
MCLSAGRPRNAVFYGDSGIDRSPCGTGTSARMAQLVAKGKLKVATAASFPRPSSDFVTVGRHYRFTLADGDWFYFVGIWRPATREWPESYAILTTAANEDVSPYHDRQMAVLRRDQRMAWLDVIRPEIELLRPLPAASFKVSRFDEAPSQSTFFF